MTEKNLEKLIEKMPSTVTTELAKGYPVSYQSNEYPNGRLESVSVNLETGEIVVLKVLREAYKK